MSFLNDSGERLAGTITWPDAPGGGGAGAAAVAAPQSANPGPAFVILCHGYMSDSGSELLVRLAGALAREGLASLRFDFSGNGGSEGRFRYGGYRAEAEEIRAAREHLAAAHGGRVVGLLGHSKGATSAVMHAARHPGIPRLVNLAGRLDVRGGVERRLGGAVLRRLEEDGQVEMRGRSRARGEFEWVLTRADLEDRLSTDVGAAAASVPAETRVLTVHGTDDADVPVSEARKFAAAVASHELLVLEGCDHRFSGPGPLLLMAPRVCEFFSEAAAA
ncbi:MAG: Alpha/Beta hydrolase protein [Monoraphidium minutum]|nr:MAG: Alpha/Beta hydrolase protein [Monoraphidium minutum]